jgi:hypothetical protein
MPVTSEALKAKSTVHVQPGSQSNLKEEVKELVGAPLRHQQ